MKKTAHLLLRTLTIYLIATLSFGLFMAYAMNISTERLSGTTAHEFLVIMALFPLILLALGHIAKRFNALFVPAVKQEKDDEDGLPVLEFDANRFKKKLLCFLTVFAVTLVVAALELYALSVVSDARIEFKTLSVISIMAAVSNALLSTVIGGLLNSISETIPGKIKALVCSVVIAALFIGFVFYVPNTVTKIATFNLYWEGNHGKPYDIVYTVNDTHELTIHNQDGTVSQWYIEALKEIPESTLCEIVNDGWNIIADSDYLAEYSWKANDKKFNPKLLYYSLKDTENKTIYVASPYVLSQELLAFSK